MSATDDELLALAEAATDFRTRVAANGYSVDEDGTVRSSQSWRGTTSRVLTPSLNGHGYLSVRLMLDGRRVHLPVHRLVAAFYLPPKPSHLHEIRHIDGDRTNSRLSNLAWGTRAENAADRERHGTSAAPRNGRIGASKLRGVNNPSAKLSEADVAAIRATYVRGSHTFGCRPLGRLYGVDPASILNIIAGRTWAGQGASK